MDGSKACDCPICGGRFTPKAGQTADEYLADGILAVYREMQNKSDGKSLPCPRCGCIRENISVPSKFAEVFICADCAAEEESGASLLPLTEWRAISQILNKDWSV